MTMNWFLNRTKVVRQWFLVEISRKLFTAILWNLEWTWSLLRLLICLRSCHLGQNCWETFRSTKIPPPWVLQAVRFSALFWRPRATKAGENSTLFKMEGGITYQQGCWLKKGMTFWLISTDFVQDCELNTCTSSSSWQLRIASFISNPVFHVWTSDEYFRDGARAGLQLPCRGTLAPLSEKN